MGRRSSSFAPSGRAIVAAVFASAGIGGAFACVDLFHSTDFQSACSQDAAAPGCPTVDAAVEAEAGPPSLDFCAWSSTEARSAATNACALLSACMGPLGGNAFGECMFDAILAYDCAANPNRRVRPGTAMHDYWECLSKAKSCDEVRTCVLPSGPENCNGGTFTACAVGAKSTAARVLCEQSGAPTMVTSCLGKGQTCVRPDTSRSRCSGTWSSTSTCTANGCAGTQLLACGDGGANDGVDCAYFGAGECTIAAATAGCKPNQGSTALQACTPTGVVTCTAGVAQGCPLGFTERVDCNRVTGACNANVGSARLDDLSRACVGASAGDAGQRCEECVSGAVHSCSHGAEYVANCASLGLGACKVVTPPQGSPIATCSAP